jgi:hypothetical protein
MTRSQRICEEIQKLLRPGVNDPSTASRLASDYTEVCKELNGRLAQIEHVLDSGDERQALLMAETQPQVMEEADALCFAKLNDWKSLCHQQGLPPAPDINLTTVQRLNAVYARGIQPGHGLYKEFRTAVMSKDDETAMRLARTIEKANPTDSNAVKERARLEKKVWEQRLVTLKGCLAQGDSPSIEQALNRVNELTPLFLDLPQPDEIRQAEDALRQWRRDGAQKQCLEWLHEATRAMSSGNWQSVGGMVARIDEAARQFELDFDAESAARLRACRDYFSKNHQEFLTQSEFEGSLKELLTQTELIESNCQAQGLSSLPELSSSLSNLNRCWQKVESFTRPVDPMVIQRVAKLVEFLRTEVARNQKRKLIIWASALVVVTCLCAAAGWWLVGLYRANDAAGQIRTAVEQKLVSGTENLIAAAEKNKLPLFSAMLQREIEEANTWIGSQKAEMSQAWQQLEDLEVAAAQDFSGQNPLQVSQRFKELSAKVENFPMEFQSEIKPRAASFSDRLSTWVDSVRGASAADLRQEVAQFESGAFEKLKVKQSVAEFTENLQSAEKIVAGWEPRINPDAEDLQPPRDLRVAVEAIQASLEGYRKHLNDLEAALRAMREATALPQYLQAVATAADSPLLQITEVPMLRQITLLQIDPAKLMADLMFPWNPEAWSAVLTGGESEKLFPDEITASENRFLQEVLNNEFLAEIYIDQIQGNPTRNVFVQGGNLRRHERSEWDYQRGVERTSYSWSGNVYDPENDAATIRFTQKDFSSRGNGPTQASAVVAKGKSPATVVFEAMQLSRMLENISVRVSIWEILDRANAAGVSAPLYQAFLAQKLDEMMRIRSFSWGGHFTPSGVEFLKNLNYAAAGKNISRGDWLRPNNDPEMIESIRSALVENSLFFPEARMNQALARAAKMERELKFAGFIGADGEVVLARTAIPTDALWGWSGIPPHQKASMLFALQNSGGADPSFRPTATALPFTPVFAFGGNRLALREQARESIRLPLNVLEKIRIPPLFENPETDEKLHDSVERPAEGTL